MFTCSRCSRSLFLGTFRTAKPTSSSLSQLRIRSKCETSSSRFNSQRTRPRPVPDSFSKPLLGINARTFAWHSKGETPQAASTSDAQEELNSTVATPTTAEAEAADHPPETSSDSGVVYLERGFPLPACCPGCGAYAQTNDPTSPGYYGKTRKKTLQAIKRSRQAFNEFQIQNGSVTNKEELASNNDELRSPERGTVGVQEGHATTEKPDYGEESQELSRSGGEQLLNSYLKVIKAAVKNPDLTTSPNQVCDRCHDLQHHRQGVPAISPTLESVHALLEESPHSTNRVYHIIDAADFPMSVLPNIFDALELQEQRSRNRRSKTDRYMHGRKMTKIDFVITRSDLLAATKEQVDSMMKYFRRVLAQAVGIESRKRDDRNAYRLGNIHMISSYRGWWTKEVKAYMREHGGGIWLVGKVNVGKSSFIQSCFPKDSQSLEKVADILLTRQQQEENGSDPSVPSLDDPVLESEGSLLPPAPREELYPTLPVVSSLPGTTVSPIRIPFGRGRGEMIDLPGLDRSTLQDFVKDEHKLALIMTKRVVPKERLRIKSQQSLLLEGGLVRITPITDDPDIVFMAACFVPLRTHVTRTDKAIGIQAGEREIQGRESIKDELFEGLRQPDTIQDHAPVDAAPVAPNPDFASAGVFHLSTDVTSNHLPTGLRKYLESRDSRKSDRHHRLEDLPYRVLSTDILIEGSGWIELTAQVRSKRSSSSAGTDFPAVEVFSPYGKCIGSRPPLQSWSLIQEKEQVERRKRGGRSRRQNIGLKKRTEGGT